MAVQRELNSWIDSHLIDTFKHGKFDRCRDFWQIHSIPSKKLRYTTELVSNYNIEAAQQAACSQPQSVEKFAA